MMRLRLLSSAVLASSLVILSGCVSLLPETEPVSVYRLTSPAPREWVQGDWQVVEIEAVQAPRGLSGAQIALVRDGRIAYVAGAQWIAPTSHILQNLVIETFNAAQSDIAPTRPEDGTRADYGLRLDLRDFQAVYDQGNNAAPLIQVRIAARLIEETERRLVSAQVFTGEIRASGHSTTAIVAAFDTASNSVARELAVWTAQRAREASEMAEEAARRDRAARQAGLN